MAKLATTVQICPDSSTLQIPFPRLRRVYNILREPSYFGVKRIQVWQMPATEALQRARRHIERMGA